MKMYPPDGAGRRAAKAVLNIKRPEKSNEESRPGADEGNQERRPSLLAAAGMT
jgi:hypothetical protein